MEIKLYYTSSENNVVNKTLENELSINNVVLKQETDILNPILILHYGINITNFNYVYIPLFKRYYYITDYKIITNSNIILNLKNDVLMTFKNDINKFDVIISRGENTTHNNYLLDNENKIQNNNNVMTIAFPQTPLNKNMYYILTTVGVEETESIQGDENE